MEIVEEYGDDLYERVYVLAADNYTQSDIARMIGYSRQRVNQILNPLKDSARTQLSKAVKKGHIIKPRLCVLCANKERLEAHHYTYDEPLNVLWICKACHVAVHKSLEVRDDGVTMQQIKERKEARTKCSICKAGIKTWYHNDVCMKE